MTRRERLRGLMGPSGILIGVLLLGEGVFYAADSFYFTDTWPIVVATGFGVFLIVLFSAQTLTASLWRHVVEVALPREQLWLRLIDPILVGQSWPAITSTEVLERREDGSAVRWLSRVRRGAYQGVLEVIVTSSVENSQYGYRTSSGSYVDYALDAIGDRTRVTRIEMVRSSLLARWLWPLNALRYRRHVEKHLRFLAEVNTTGAAMST